MTISSHSNGAEFHRVVLRTKPRGRQQKTQDLRVGLGGPTSEKVQQQKHQQPSEQAIEQIEGRGTEAHGEKEELSFGPEDREGPGKRTMHSIDASWFRHLLLHWDREESIAGKKPREEIHRGDGHSHAEEHAREHTLRSAFPKGESEASHNDGNEREAASDGAGESCL
jgi:hypothetical protein